MGSGTPYDKKLVSNVTYGGISYSADNLTTDSNGKVYLYLPASIDAELVKLTVDGTAYGKVYVRDATTCAQTLEALLQYAIVLDKAGTHDFGTETYGYTAPELTVRVTNTGYGATDALTVGLMWEEETVNKDNNTTTAGEVDVKVSLQMPATSSLTTYAMIESDENRVNYIAVLAFDDDGTFVYANCTKLEIQQIKNTVFNRRWFRSALMFNFIFHFYSPRSFYFFPCSACDIPLSIRISLHQAFLSGCMVFARRGWFAGRIYR